MLWPVRLSFVCSRSATLVHPAQAVVIFGNVSRHLVRWPSTDIHEKVYEDRPTGSLPSGELNTTGVACKYSNFGPIEGYILETVQDRR